MESPHSQEAGPSPTYTIFRNKHGIPQFEPKRGTQALKDALSYAFPSFETELQLMQAALRKFFDGERGSRSVFELPERDLQAGLAEGKDVPAELGLLQPANAALKNFNFAAGLRAPSRNSWRSSPRPSSRVSSRASSRTSSRMSSRAESPYYSQEQTDAGGLMTTWSLASGQDLEKRRRQPYDSVKRRRVAENRGNACEKHRAAKTTCDPKFCPQNKLYSKVSKEMRKTCGNLASQEGFTATNTPSKDEVSEMDAPWDGTDEGMDFDDQESIPGLDLTLTSTSSSASWTDQPSGRSPWNTLSIHEPIVEQPTGDSNCLFPIQVATTADVSMNSSGFEVLGILPHDHQDVGPFSVPLQGQSLQPQERWLPSDQVDEPFKCNEDPFMGWANKQAARALDDYGWVVSHVESL